MASPTCWLLLTSLCVPLCAATATAEPFGRDFVRASVSLTGPWEWLGEHGDQEVFRPEVAKQLGPWKTVNVPGNLTPGLNRQETEKLQSVWVRKRFSLDAKQAARDAVLKWANIRHGATVWINGQYTTSHPVIGPHTILLPPPVLHEGENELLLKVPGWSGIAKSKSGYPLIPTGSGTQRWGSKRAAIHEDIWLEFYSRAYLKWALAMPDVRGGRVTFRVWVDGAGALPDRINLTATVRTWPGQDVAGRASGEFATSKTPIEISVPVKDAKLWTLETRHLYVASLRAEADGQPCDEVQFRFGMRQIEIVDGHFRLNGKPLWFRGSNLVNEWLWGQRFSGNPKEYIVDEARAMNLNSFRTHTLPPPNSWLNVCDEHGTMILAELPVLYNNRDFEFTPEEWKIFHEHALLDAIGWVTKLWNHPSLMIWVLSNESPNDVEWEAGEYWRHVKGLDPTRPAMRAGDYPDKMQGTPDIADMHTCGNYSWGAEGRAMVRFAQAAAAKDPKRPLMNTEYMNRLATPAEQATHWLGRPDHPYANLSFAECATEHTEAMRRHNFDGILPYMFAGWTRARGHNWRPDFPTPMAAALHSAMSPILASLDLFDRNFVAGSEVTTRLAMISEKHDDVRAEVDIYLTPEDPMFVPVADALKSPVWHDRFEWTFKASSIGEKSVRWRVPEKPGLYYLAAVVRREGAQPVVSQRVVRSFSRAGLYAKLHDRKAVVLGADQDARSWLKLREITFTETLGQDRIAGDVVVIWNESTVGADQRSAAPAIRSFVEAGGRLVILAQPEWTWRELIDFEPAKEYSSRAFPYPGAEHRMLDGIDPEYLKRWNGLPGRVADKAIEGDVLKQGRKLLWIETPEHVVAHALPLGKGEIVICYLKLKPRILSEADAYDPVAEAVLVNLLAD